MTRYRMEELLMELFQLGTRLSGSKDRNQLLVQFFELGMALPRALDAASQQDVLAMAQRVQDQLWPHFDSRTRRQLLLAQEPEPSAAADQYAMDVLEPLPAVNPESLKVYRVPGRDPNAHSLLDKDTQVETYGDGSPPPEADFSGEDV